MPHGLVTACDPSQQPGQRSGVNGPGPPRPAGGVALPGPAGEGAQKRCPNAHLAPRRSLRRVPALPAPCRARSRAGPATGDGVSPVDLPTHSPLYLPLSRVRGRYRGEDRGRRGEFQPWTRARTRTGQRAGRANQPRPGAPQGARGGLGRERVDSPVT